MKRKQMIPMLAIAIVTVIIVSCSKTGPAGATGATGAMGAGGSAGPVGAAGAKGDTGTANVIYSPWFAFATTDWKDSVLGGIISCKRAIRTEAKITQSIIDNGLVLGYLKNLDFGSPFTLPFTSTNSSNITNITSLLPAVGELIYYNAYSNNGGGFAWDRTSFRYVIIPGGVATTGLNAGSERTGVINGKTYTESQLKAMPYSEICNAMNVTQ
jgi:hypothetical protein